VNDDILDGLTDGTFRARWLREVLRSSQITESIKLLLVAFAIEGMNAAGHVSVPREELAVRIGRGKARVSERLQEAVDQGFLVRLSSGKRGSTAVYAAAISGSACSDPNEGGEESGKGPDSRTSTEGGKGPATRTITKFGSDLQDAIDPNRTKFGSDLQDAIDQPNDVQVRIPGPNDEKKGPGSRDAKVYKGSGVSEVISDPATGSLLDLEPKAPAKRKTKIPDSFAVTPEMRAWAAAKTPGVNIDFQTEQFIDHWRGKGELRLDWVATWRTWMRNQHMWHGDRQSGSRTTQAASGRTGNGSGHHMNPDTDHSKITLEDL
jgi:hypothetical protein